MKGIVEPPSLKEFGETLENRKPVRAENARGFREKARHVHDRMLNADYSGHGDVKAVNNATTGVIRRGYKYHNPVVKTKDRTHLVVVKREGKVISRAEVETKVITDINRGEVRRRKRDEIIRNLMSLMYKPCFPEERRKVAQALQRVMQS